MDYDLESAALIRALKEADAQKAMTLNTGLPANRMVSGRYVAPGMGEMVNAFVTPEIGRYNEQRVMDKQRALNEQQNTEVDSLLNELTTPGTKSVLTQALRQGEGPLLQPNMDQVESQVPLSPVEESRRRLGVYGKMSRLPKAAQMAQAGIRSEVDFPERQALLEQQQIEKGEQAALRLREQEKQQQIRLDDQRERDKDRFAQQRAMATLAASLRPPAAPRQRQTVTTDQGVLEWDGEKWAPIMVGDKVAMKPPTAAATAAAAGKPVSVQQQKAQDATSSLLSTVNMGLDMVGESSGAGTVIPGAIRQMYTSPTTKIADSTIGQLSAEKAHELYGAAFTKAEMSRAGTFLPENTDTVDTKRWKLAQMKILLEKKQAMLHGKPDPYPNTYNDIIVPLSKGEVPGAGVSTEDAAARAWLDANPNDPRAAAVRKKLEGK